MVVMVHVSFIMRRGGSMTSERKCFRCVGCGGEGSARMSCLVPGLQSLSLGTMGAIFPFIYAESLEFFFVGWHGKWLFDKYFNIKDKDNVSGSDGACENKALKSWNKIGW